MSENSKSLYRIMSEVLNIDITELSSESTPHDFESWDSFNTMKIIYEIEQVFAVELPLADVISLKKVKDIESLLIKKGVQI